MGGTLPGEGPRFKRDEALKGEALKGEAVKSGAVKGKWPNRLDLWPRGGLQNEGWGSRARHRWRERGDLYD